MLIVLFVFFISSQQIHILSRFFFLVARKTLLDAANRHRDGDGGSLHTSGGGEHIERKGSFASNPNTHHRYRHKDRRYHLLRSIYLSIYLSMHDVQRRTSLFLIPIYGV